MTSDEVVGAATAAADAWSQANISGTFLDVQMNTSLDVTPATGQDSFHDIVFKNPWCDPGDTTCQIEALAITSVWAGQTSGTIVDADIEVNAQYDFWTDLVNHPATGKQDLQNALTHEMGHLIGLDHNCYTPGSDPVHMVDNTGVLVPCCLGADADIQNDVMYTKADPGDIVEADAEARRHPGGARYLSAGQGPARLPRGRRGGEAHDLERRMPLRDRFDGGRRWERCGRHWRCWWVWRC